MSIVRDLTLRIKKYLSGDEILLIIGARQCGKTTVLHQIEEIIKKENKQYYFLNLEDPDYLSLLNQSPKNLFKIFPFDLKKKSFLLIDEIQYLNNPTNFLKYFYDEYKKKIKIIATGSSAFYLDRKFKDSLSGRKRIFNLWTLSFREFLRFKEEMELSEKNFDNLTLSEKEKIMFYYQEYLIWGGYPRVVLSSIDEKEEILRDIAYSYIKKDIFEANIRYESVFYKLFKILAFQIGNLVNNSELSSTLMVSRTLIEDYILLMQKSFHIRLINPFFKSLRKEITKMPKVYFLDLGLRNFLIKDFKTFHERQDKGQILENALFRQLIEKYEVDEIKFWRTTSKNEVDFIIEGKNAYEVKVNPHRFQKGKLKSFIETYPNINLSLVCLETEKEKINSFFVHEVWRI